MNGETRVHMVVVGVGAATLALVLVFWIWPRLIIYGLLGLAAVLAYGALYLIIAAWVDPKRPPGPLPQDGSSESPPVVAPQAKKKARKTKAKRKTTKKKAATRSKARKAKPAEEDS